MYVSVMEITSEDVNWPKSTLKCADFSTQEMFFRMQLSIFCLGYNID